MSYSLVSKLNFFNDRWSVSLSQIDTYQVNINYIKLFFVINFPFPFQSLTEMLGGDQSDVDGDDSAERIRDIFEKIDANNDGKVSLQEFVEICSCDDQMAKLLSLSSDG